MWEFSLLLFFVLENKRNARKRIYISLKLYLFFDKNIELSKAKPFGSSTPQITDSQFFRFFFFFFFFRICSEMKI